MSLENIQVALNFIEKHLKEEISVADIAAAANFSLFHFCRIFNQWVGHSPYDYLMRRRLTEAANELLNSDRRIIDVACDYRFHSPETFSRAFKRMFNLQPYEWRKGRQPDLPCFLPPVTAEYLQHIQLPKPYSTEALNLAGWMTHLPQNNREPIAALWALLAEQPPPFYGVLYPMTGEALKGSFYLAATQNTAGDAPPEGGVEKHLPARRWARFHHCGPLSSLALTYRYILHTWLPLCGFQQALPYMLEVYSNLPGDFAASVDILVPWEV